MAYKIIETELAQQDLNDIVDYIICSLENPLAAATLLDEVEACYSSLFCCRLPHHYNISFQIRKFTVMYPCQRAKGEDCKEGEVEMATVFGASSGVTSLSLRIW